jgi:hypothetical protein
LFSDVNLSLPLTKRRAMKTDGEAEVFFHAFLTSALDGVTGRPVTGETATGNHQMSGGACPRAGLHTEEKTKINLMPLPGTEHRLTPSGPLNLFSKLYSSPLIQLLTILTPPLHHPALIRIASGLHLGISPPPPPPLILPLLLLIRIYPCTLNNERDVTRQTDFHEILYSSV